MSLQPVQRSTTVALPARYYLNHFNEFLEVIEDRYQHVLEPEHTEFVLDFKNLNEDAQCLYVRMLNRRGRVFDCRRFKYAEILDIPVQLVCLKRGGFIRNLDRGDLRPWFELITRDTLLELIAQQCSPGSYRRSWSKSNLIEFATAHLSYSHPSMSTAMTQFIVQSRCEQIGYLLFLYFGKFEAGLSRFTLRDLGVVRTSKFKHKFQPRFDDKQSALSTWFYCQKVNHIRAVDPLEHLEIAETIGSWPDPVGEQSKLLRQHAIYRLGEQVEKSGEHELARKIYLHSDSWPSSERLIRLMYAKGDRVWVSKALEKIIDDPSCEEELLFARDFFLRKFHKKRTSRITDILRSATVLRIDECYRDTPEEGAADYFSSRGAQVFHTENRVWKKLFGLLFWDILFHSESAAIYNDFEKRPRDLDTGLFYRRFTQEIEQKIALLDNADTALQAILVTVTSNYGAANSIFRWRANMLDEIRAFLPAVCPKAVASMLRRMAQNYA
ncbi:MAG: hypothetical protein ACR2QW_14415, partial [bacterium]